MKSPFNVDSEKAFHVLGVSYCKSHQSEGVLPTFGFLETQTRITSIKCRSLAFQFFFKIFLLFLSRYVLNFRQT